MSSGQLVVRLGSVLAALPAAAVRRVARALPLAPLPGSSGALLGLIEFAGEPLPVLDLARLLDSGVERSAPPSVTVIAWVGAARERELVGLAVDEALDVATLEPSEIPGEASRLGAPVRLVDLERLELGR